MCMCMKNWYHPAFARKTDITQRNHKNNTLRYVTTKLTVLTKNKEWVAKTKRMVADHEAPLVVDGGWDEHLNPQEWVHDPVYIKTDHIDEDFSVCCDMIKQEVLGTNYDTKDLQYYNKIKRYSNHNDW